MFGLKEKLESTLQAAIWGAIAASAAVATIFFLCVAVFVWTTQNYGTVTACMVLAVIFLVVATGAAIAFSCIRRAQADRARARDTAVGEKWWLDPAVVAASLQVGKTLGARPIVPFLVLVASFAGWMLLSQPTVRESPAPPPS
jgi:hypothetical protein